MPSLTWLGRRWRLASDDLFVPASCTAAVRSIGGVLLWLQWCPELSPSLRLACSATHYANAAAILLELLVIRQSTRGAVVDCDSRDRAVRPLLTAHLALSLGETCLGVLAATQVEYAAAASCGVSLFLLRASLLAYLCFVVVGLSLLATLVKCGHAHEVAAEGSNPNPNPNPNPNLNVNPYPGVRRGLGQAVDQGSVRVRAARRDRGARARAVPHLGVAAGYTSALRTPPPPPPPPASTSASASASVSPSASAAASASTSTWHSLWPVWLLLRLRLLLRVLEGAATVATSLRHETRVATSTDRCVRPSSS